MPLQVINGIGRVGIRSASPAVSAFDADAQAFITATGLTDTTQKNAINDLVLDLKAAGVWTKLKAIYPMIGGTPSTHQFNLKDPRDLDAAFRLVFNGGWTHSATGALPNGSNAYANTFLIPSTSLILNNSHLSLYNRTNATSYFNATKIDALLATQTAMAMLVTTSEYGSRFMDDTYSAISSPNALGFYIGNRTLSTQKKYYKNGTLGGTFNVNSLALPDRNITISSIFGNGYTVYSSGQCAFASIGDGLTDLESTLFYQIVEKFQYTLGRNINATQPFYYNSAYSNETNAFIFNGGITDATQISAVNTLVTTLKTAGVWTKMKAVYPMVGGTATSHKFNLVNPVDTDAAYRLVFNGGWTHSANGALPNGTTGYANSNLNPLVQNNTHLSYYSKTNLVGGGDIGNWLSYPSGNPAYLYIKVNSGNTAFRLNAIGTESNIARADARGFAVVNRISSSTQTLFFNNVKNDFTVASLGVPSGNITIGAVNFGGTYEYGNKQCAFASIGDGLTDAEATTFYNAVQAFQTTLNRQV